MDLSSFIIDGNSCVTFINNTALQDGRAIYLRDQSDFELLKYSNASFYYTTVLLIMVGQLMFYTTSGHL